MPQSETLAADAGALQSTDVLIVGGGVCGTALLFVLARYTSLRQLTLVERHAQLAQVNSRASSNSQTIHWILVGNGPVNIIYNAHSIYTVHITHILYIVYIKYIIHII